MDWLQNNQIGQTILLILVLVLVRQAIRMFLATLIQSAVHTHHHESVESEKKREDTLIHIVATSLTVLIWVFGIIGILVILRVNIAGLITGAGVVGLVVGLGGQSAIKDYLGGFFILMENQYRVGDIIAIGAVTGTVESISLRLTQIRDLDGDLHSIPHGSITVVTNKSFGWSNVNINIEISHDADIEKVKKVINDTGLDLSSDSVWQHSIITPISFMRVDAFADSSVTIKALGKVQAGKQWEVAGEFRARLKQQFKKHKIEI